MPDTIHNGNGGIYQKKYHLRDTKGSEIYTYIYRDQNLQHNYNGNTGI